MRLARLLVLIVTFVMFPRYCDLMAENCVFLYPSLIRRPLSLSSLWNFAVKLSVRKLESWGYSVVKVA